MALDAKTQILIRLSAAIAANALVSIRQAYTEALNSGITLEEVEETIKAALEIQRQPISHAEQMVHQLKREQQNKDKTPTGSACCANHHHSH